MLFMIGVIEDAFRNVLKLRILDTNTMEFRDREKESVYRAVIDGKMKIENLCRDNVVDILYGVSNKLDSFTKLIGSKLVQDKRYTPIGVDWSKKCVLVDVNGTIYRMSRKDIKRYRINITGAIPFRNVWGKDDFIFNQLNQESCAIIDRYNSKRRLLGLNEVLLGNINGNITLVSAGHSTGVENIPSFVTYIGSGAFEECNKLEKVVMYDNIKSIGDSAFYECIRLQSIKLPESLESIGSYAFYGSGIKEVKIGSKLKKLQDNIFFNCKRLSKVDIPDNIDSIGCASFYGCSSLGKIELGKNIKCIGDSAFSNSGIKKVIIDCNIESIPINMFYWCIYLEEVYISNNIEVIGNNAFNLCGNLKKINIIGGKQSKGIDFPTNLRNIEYRAFSDCRAIENIHLPDTLERIEYGAFSGCTSLKNIRLPSSIKTIEKYVFSNCSGLKSIDIPENVDVIDKYAFEDCSLLESVKIHNKAIKIGESAFVGCNRLSEVLILDGDSNFKRMNVDDVNDGYMQR